MIFKIKNLGPIREAGLELGELTLICGPNNTGKTYASYALFSFLENYASFTDFKLSQSVFDALAQKGFVKIDLREYEKKIPDLLADISKAFTRKLREFFNADVEQFSQTAITADFPDKRFDYSQAFDSHIASKRKKIIQARLNQNSHILEVFLGSEKEEEIPPDPLIADFINSALARIFFGNSFPDPFIFTAERTGVSLFYRELNIANNTPWELLDQPGNTRKWRLVPSNYQHSTVSRYPSAVRSNVDFFQDLNQISKNKSPLFHSPGTGYIERILDGSFEIEDEEIRFTSKNSVDGENATQTPLNMTSSAVKSLVGLDFYVKHMAHKGQILMIDEPEICLHPDNQRWIARFFAALVNNGVKIFITTHSDYIVKELSNLIMLSNEFKRKKEIVEKYRYAEAEFLKPEQVRVYVAGNGTLRESPIDPKAGIALDTFDHVINEMNSASTDIFYELNLGDERLRIN